MCVRGGGGVCVWGGGGAKGFMGFWGADQRLHVC